MLATIRATVSRISATSRRPRGCLLVADHWRTQSHDVGQQNLSPSQQQASPGDPVVRPQVNEDDLEEKFISGSGPGGQSVNKSVNCCQLRHKPTGIVIKVHQTRSLEKNRQLARELLARRLDNLQNGELSLENQKRHKALARRATRDSQNERKRLMKEQYKQTLAQSNADQTVASGDWHDSAR